MSGDSPVTLGGLGPYLTILVAAALPTQVWRWLGVLLAGRLDEQSELFTWVKAVATALVAGVIAKLLLTPSGPLATVPVLARLAAAGVGFGVYIASGRRFGLGVAVAELLLLASWFTLR